MKKRICEYKDCPAKAEFTLGMADPDAELNYYCGGHIDKVKEEMTMRYFMEKSGCEANIKNGRKCLNSKKFGNLCGIHQRQHVMKEKKNAS